jgi:predicted MFS family arabinose efflux permease
MDLSVLDPRATLASYRSDLAAFDTTTKLLFVGIMINAVGTGFILPFITIYFHEVVGLQYGIIGLALGFRAVIDIGSKLVAGETVDRIGRKTTLIVAILFLISGYAGYILARDLIGLLIAVTLEGIGIGLFWPSTLSMVSDLVGDEMREKAYALDRAIRTGGLGIGIALGGFIATFSYVMLYYLDITFTAIFLLIVLFKLPETRPDDIGQDGDGLLTALRDHRLMAFVLLSSLFATMMAHLFQILAPYLKDFLGVSNLLIGNVFLIYAALLVMFQLKVTDRIEDIPAMDAVRTGFILWGGAAALIFLAQPGTSALVLSVLALLLISFAGMVFGPASITLVTDIAPDDKRGAYISVYSIAWSSGFIVGPVVGGWFLDSAQPGLLWLLLAGLASAGLAGVGLYRRRFPGVT